MKKVDTICLCDIDKCKETSCTPMAQTVTVIFTTEQTEGKSTKPYLEQKTIDICSNCMEKVFSGKMIFAAGAQGYNTYYFNK